MIGCRRGNRRNQAIPIVGFDLRHAELRRGGHRRQARKARAAANRQRPQLARLDAAEQHGHVGEHHLHVATEQIVHRRCGARIGTWTRSICAVSLSSSMAQMRHAAEARRGEHHLARLRLCQR